MPLMPLLPLLPLLPRPRVQASSRCTPCPALVVALLLASGPASAQIPPTRTSSESSMAPMPTPQPIPSAPPDVGGPGPASQPAPPPVIQPVYSPPAPASTMAVGPVDPAVTPPPPNPADTAEAPRRRWAWGEASTLLARDAKVGLYLGPTFKLTGINRRPALMLGAEFAVIIGERFSIGAAGSVLTTPLPAVRSDGRTFNMRMQYAGLTLGVALVRVKFFSLGVGALIGGGRVCLNDERLDRCVNKAGMFVAEPELGVSFALTKVLRLSLSGGYRVAFAQAWSGPADTLLRGFTGTLGFRLGRY